MKVLVTGATGFVGKVLVKDLIAAGDEVHVLTRNVARAAIHLGSKCKYFLWDGESVPPTDAFEGVEGVVHLMGESIAEKKWDEEQKQKIIKSRIDGTQKLLQALRGLTQKPKVLVSASAIGIYGDRGEEEITEASSEASDFLAGVCKNWEAAALEAKELGLRVALMRTGIVLGRKGGALAKMLPIFKLGLGGPIGNGKQYMSWVHVEDLSRMYLFALKNKAVVGPWNCTAPYPATNAFFTKELGRALKRPAFLPVPPQALKLIFGEMSSILLDGAKVVPVKFKEQHFRYHYPTLEMALKETAY